MSQNNFKEMQKIIGKLGDSVPSLLLHSCCAPCSSSCLELLSGYFDVTVFYYNPNICSAEEYDKRAEEQSRLIEAMPSARPIHLIISDYRPEEFLSRIKGLENEPERGARCSVCYALRLENTAKLAADKKYDYFTTTLTLSPLKDAERINEIGTKLAEQYGARWLPCDFKKGNGFLRSLELSKKYDLYRQNFCGCSFSKKTEND